MERFVVPLTLLLFLVAFASVALPALSRADAAPADAVLAQAAAGQEGSGAPVWVTTAKGIIDPALASFLVKTMGDAADAEAAALVVELDTPGGLDTAMRDIIQAELDAPIPVVFYVYPQGARAASAGVYILMGADVASMAPQTNLGAATPVAMGGEMDDVMKAKVTNDAAAYISGLATTHERNAAWAERAVRESVSLTAAQALEQNVIEFVSPDLPALLEAMDGYVTVPKGLTLHTAGAPVEEVSMGWVQRFLHAIANPDVAYILLTIGILGIIAEFSTPGFGGAGIGGAIALLLAFYSFQILPVSLVGIAFVVLAMILFVAEIFIQSNGVLGIGGAAALIAGGFLLFDTSLSFLKVSWPVVIAVAVLALLFFVFVIMAVARARRRPVTVGAETMVGATGVAVSPISPSGQVRLHGETWKARAEGADLSKDEPIEVIGSEGLTLIVRRATQSDAATEAQTEQNHQDQGT
jgi:membrane-bound serine protease (ClpP class)